ncbi:MAG: transposase [Cyanobacteriota bacterium]|nr:transposase [Cyanobacteriota bacterium]
MKVHIGVEAESGLIHSMQPTSANLHGLTPASALLHREGNRVYADSGHQGIDKRPELADTDTEFRVAMRSGKR